MNKKVIISGASGQDGSYMAEYVLANTDFDIVLTMRRTSQDILSNLQGILTNSRVKVSLMDLNDVHSITQLIEQEKPDYFINFGASTFVPDSWNSPAQVMQTNAVSLIHILEAVRRFAPKCHVYSSGSSEQFGNVEYSPQDIKHPHKPRSIYGVSKSAAQMICKVYRESYGLYVVHGVLFNHESERRQETFVSRKIAKGVARIARSLKDDEDFEPLELGNLDSYRDFSHAKDFMHGIWTMLNQETPKEFILASGELHSIREFVERAFAFAKIKGVWRKGIKGRAEDEEYLLSKDGFLATKKKVPLVTINPKFYRPAEVQTLLGNSEPARKELNWRPEISFTDLVKRMVEAELRAVGL